MGDQPKNMMTTFSSPGLNVIRIQRSDFNELFATIKDVRADSFSNSLLQIANHFQDQKAKIIKMNSFGSLTVFNNFMNLIRDRFGEIKWPINFISGENCFGDKMTGVQIYAITNLDVKSIYLNDSPIGCFFEDYSARYCHLGNIHADHADSTYKQQTLETLKKLEWGLKQAGMAMTDIVRTWFYNHNIIHWYDQFNAVRNEFYHEKGIFNGLLPASTGIGADNPYQTALVTDALAIQPKNDTVSVAEVPSPMQCPAPDYRSSFSRAVEVSTPDYRQLFVSGTASIDPEGRTAHIGDVNGQIDLTFRVVKAILAHRGMDYSDVSRAIAYFKHKQDAEALNKYLHQYELSSAQVIVANNDICRDELLFEIEVDAISKTP